MTHEFLYAKLLGLKTGGGGGVRMGRAIKRFEKSVLF